MQAKEEISKARVELERDVRERKQELAKENTISVKSIIDAMFITGDRIEGISKGQTK